MFRHVAWVVLLLGFSLSLARARAAGADDLFIAIYNLIQQADAKVEGGGTNEAYESFLKAQEDLRNLQRQYPTWNERVVNYRLRYVGERLATLKTALQNGPAKTESTKDATGANTNAPVSLAPPGEVVSQFNSLNEQIQRLGAEKSLLEAKLREALTAQPAPVDPRQLHEAVERISSLQQTNKVLLTKLEEQEKERKNLVDKVVAEEAQRALNEANRQLLEQRLAASKAEKAKSEIESQLKQLQEGPIKKLEGENSALKQQVTELKSDTEKGRQVADLAGKLGRLQTQLEDFKKQNETLLSEKTALEKHLSDINVRKAEESIIRVAKLETDLALAQADAARNSQKAEALAMALGQAKTNFIQLEDQNRSLGDRVAALTRENLSATNAVKRLQDALAEEQTGRTELERKLRQAEQQLASLNPNPPREPAPPRSEGGPPPPRPAPKPITPEIAERAAALEAEAKTLKNALRESRDRETEVKNLLAEEQSLRVQLQREKADLERKISTLNAAVAASTNTPLSAAVRVTGNTSPASSSAAVLSPSAQVTASLERRIHELERQREELQQRLLSAGIRLENSPVRRLRITTPREHAAENRQRRF
jgi:chromosome segregation ATPase